MDFCKFPYSKENRVLGVIFPGLLPCLQSRRPKPSKAESSEALSGVSAFRITINRICDSLNPKEHIYIIKGWFIQFTYPNLQRNGEKGKRKGKNFSLYMSTDLIIKSAFFFVCTISSAFGRSLYSIWMKLEK